MNDIKAPLKCDRCHGPLDTISRIYSDEYDGDDIEIVCSKCYDKYELEGLKDKIKSLRSQIREKQKYRKCVKGGGHYFEEPEEVDTTLYSITQIYIFEPQRGCTKCGYGHNGDSYQFQINGNDMINIGQLEFRTDLSLDNILNKTCIN